MSHTHVAPSTAATFGKLKGAFGTTSAFLLLGGVAALHISSLLTLLALPSHHPPWFQRADSAL